MSAWTRVTDGTSPTAYIATNESPQGVDRWVGTNDPTPTLPIGFNVFYRGLSNDMRVSKYPDTGSLIYNANFGGGLTSSSGSAYFAGPVEAPFIGSPYRELHTFVRGNDGLMYGRFAAIQGAGSLVVSPDWYSFGNLGRIFRKPDAVTWDGIPPFPPPCT